MGRKEVEIIERTVESSGSVVSLAELVHGAEIDREKEPHKDQGERRDDPEGGRCAEGAD